MGKEEFGIAKGLVEEGLRAKPDLVWPNRLLAVSAAHSGDLEEARQAVARLVEAHPDLTIEKLMEAVPRGVLRKQDYYWEGLRLAGLPEK